MYFEVFKFIVIFAGYELNPLKQVKYKTIYKMRKVSLALLLCLLCLAGMAQGQKALDLKDITSGRFRPENIQGVIPTPDSIPASTDQRIPSLFALENPKFFSRAMI